MKMKDMSEDDPNNDDVVPIAVQIFLWRQTTPFMRPRFGKVHESTCTVSILFQFVIVFLYSKRDQIKL